MLRLLLTRSAALELRANVVDFYSNRYILTADGNVTARLTDGTVGYRDTFSMDLKLNRFLIAGNVHLDGPHIHQLGRPLPVSLTSRVTTWSPRVTCPTVLPTTGSIHRSAPRASATGDAFYFPDLSGDKPYIISDSATIFLKNNLEFPVGARILVLGVYIPTPGYVVNYSSNPNFYQNAFSGATFDIGIPFKAAADAMSAAHIRYDPYRGLYTAFDQHFVHNLDYAVFSVDPVTQTQRQFNAVLYKRLSPAVEARTFFQLSADSQGLSQR